MHKLTDLNLKMILLAFLTASLIACGDGDGGGAEPTDPGIVDTDGDGLSDDDEINIYGTDPSFEDTDGDGLSDGREVNELGFNSGVNPYVYNPLVADLPKFEFEIVTVPKVFFNYTDTNGNSQEISNASGGSNTTGQTTSKSNEVSIGAELGFDGFKLQGKVTSSYTHGWGSESSTENQTTWENALSSTTSTQRETGSGGMSLGLVVRNTGHVAYTLNNLTLSAFQTAKGKSFESIGTLSYDAGDLTIAPLPNTETDPLIFSRDNIDVATVMDIWKNSQSISIRPAAYTITDQDDTQLAYDIQAVASRSGRVMIDYAFNRDIEEYWVATNTDPDNPGKSLAEILSDVLQVPYVEGTGSGSTTTHTGLTSVRSLAHTGVNGRWLVTHVRDTGVDVVSTVYDIDTQDYSLANINVQRGDEVFITYLLDEDGDGLGVRQEHLYGTYDRAPDVLPPDCIDAGQVDPVDSDCDGRNDYDEVHVPWTVSVYLGPGREPIYEVYSSPTYRDIDGDNVFDIDELAQGTDPAKADTDEDGANDGADTNGSTGYAAINASLRSTRSDNQFGLLGVVGASTGNSLTDVTIDWGDGSPVVNVAGVSGSSYPIGNLWHDFSVDGGYDITVTAKDSGGNSLTQTGRIWNRAVRTIDVYGRNTYWRHYRHIVDVVDMNNDGLADIVGIADTAIYWSRAIADGDFRFSDRLVLKDGWGANNYNPCCNSFTIMKPYFTDLNNDGFTDLLVYDRYAVYAFMNTAGTNGRQLVGPTRVVNDLGPLNGWNTADEIRQVADVNGDNRPDLVAINNARGLVVYINDGDTNADGVPDFRKIADQSSTFNAASGYSALHERVFADVNGDGYDDLVGFGETGVQVKLSQGNGQFAAVQPVMAGGFDNASGWTSQHHDRLLVDVNGDGRFDLAGFGPDGVYVSVNESTLANLSFLPAHQVLADFGTDQGWEKQSNRVYVLRDFLPPSWDVRRRHNRDQRMFADVNGDGSLDIVGYDLQGVHVAMNDGNGGFQPATLFHSVFAGPTTHLDDAYISHFIDLDIYYEHFYTPRFTADLNGDGFADFVGFTDRGATIYLAPRIYPFQ